MEEMDCQYLTRLSRVSAAPRRAEASARRSLQFALAAGGTARESQRSTRMVILVQGWLRSCEGSSDIDDYTREEISTSSIHLRGFRVLARVDRVHVMDHFEVEN
jgi:hypothetical protein